MNVKRFIRTSVVLSGVLLTALLLFTTSAVLAEPSPHASASGWQLYEPVGEMIVPVADKRVRAVEEKGGHAYVLTSDGYLYTYDITDLPRRWSFTTYDAPTSFLAVTNGRGLLRNGDYLYVFGHAGLVVMDVRNPAVPSVCGATGGFSIYNLIRHDNYLVATGYEGVVVYSIEEPSNPVWFSELYSRQEARVWSAAVYSDTLYTYDWTTDWQGNYTNAFSVIDFSDPVNLSVSSMIACPAAVSHLRVVGDQLVECGTSHVGLWNLDAPSGPVFQESRVTWARACARDGDNIVTNGLVFRAQGGVLEIVAAFEPGGRQAEGFPFGSAAGSDFVFIAQSKRVLILNASVRIPLTLVYLPLVRRQ